MVVIHSTLMTMYIYAVNILHSYHLSNDDSVYTASVGRINPIKYIYIYIYICIYILIFKEKTEREFSKKKKTEKGNYIIFKTKICIC